MRSRCSRTIVRRRLGAPADHRDRHAGAGRAAPAGLARAGPRARPALRRGRVRHAGRRVPGAEPAPGQAHPRRRAHRPAAGLEGDPRRCCRPRDTTRCWRRSRSGSSPRRSWTPRRRRAGRRTTRPGCGSACTWARTASPAARRRPADRLAEIATAAEAAGFDAIYVMDHFRQIPQIGRAWDDFLESYTTLGVPGRLHHARTDRRAGHRHHVPERRAPGQDRRHARRAQRRPRGVRARAGLVQAGAHRVRLAVPVHLRSLRPARGRPAGAADAVGPGQPGVRGPGPLAARTRPATRGRCSAVPIIVGGGGERRTLRLAAQYADAANVMGDLATVRRKRDVLREHCAAVGRDQRRADAPVDHAHRRRRPAGHRAGRPAAAATAGSGPLRRRGQRRHGRRPHRPVPPPRRGGRPGGDDPPPRPDRPRAAGAGREGHLRLPLTRGHRLRLSRSRPFGWPAATGGGSAGRDRSGPSCRPGTRPAPPPGC